MGLTATANSSIDFLPPLCPCSQVRMLKSTRRAVPSRVQVRAVPHRGKWSRAKSLCCAWLSPAPSPAGVIYRLGSRGPHTQSPTLAHTRGPHGPSRRLNPVGPLRAPTPPRAPAPPSGHTPAAPWRTPVHRLPLRPLAPVRPCRPSRLAHRRLLEQGSGRPSVVPSPTPSIHVGAGPAAPRLPGSTSALRRRPPP